MQSPEVRNRTGRVAEALALSMACAAGLSKPTRVMIPVMGAMIGVAGDAQKGRRRVQI